MIAVMLMISVVLFNHMGLCETIEKVLHYKFKILSCSKCGTFWASLISYVVGGTPIIESIALSFVLAYIALWLELALALMAKWYETCYDKISEAETDKDNASSENQMP